MSDLLDKKAACAALGGISEATLWRGVKSGRFPQPIKLGRFIARWRREELSACVDRMAADRV
jgi:prophage regulatory protein